MEQNLNTIECPHCHKKITLDEALTHSLEENLKKDIESKYNSKIKKYEKDITDLKKSKDKEIEDALKFQKSKIEKGAKEKAEKSMRKDLKDLQEQLNEKDELLEKAEKEELKLRKERRQLEDDKKRFEIESQRKLDEERKTIYEEATKKANDEIDLKLKEKDKQNIDLRNQISELKRKSEQGSQQLQGEVLELEIERILRENFSMDNISPISTGVKGADILQKVCSNNGKECGSILIESKRAKWSETWISKLKKDQREEKCDLAVLASTSLPEGIDTFAYRDGVIIVSYKTIVPVIVLLRNQLIELHRSKMSNVDKNEKMEMIYTYLTGTEFRQKIESMAESFIQMMGDLQKEKRAFTKIWSKREKQIEQACYGLAGMYGSMQGIIGSSLPEIKQLDVQELLLEQKNPED
jgi:hypothetical protein